MGPKPWTQSEQIRVQARCKALAVYTTHHNQPSKWTAPELMTEPANTSCNHSEPVNQQLVHHRAHECGEESHSHQAVSSQKSKNRDNHRIDVALECSRANELARWHDGSRHAGLAGEWSKPCSWRGGWLVYVAVLCVVALSSPSVSCLVIQSPSGTVLHNYDTNSANHNQHVVDHRTRSWQGESASQDDYSQEVSVEEDMADETGPKINPNDTEICYTNECIKATGYLMNSLNLQANPCEDFYQYACGNWVKDHPIPAYVKSWSHFQRVFYTIRDELIEKLNSKEKFEKDTGNRTVFNKLFNFFHGCKNQEQRNATGYTPLYSLIKQLGGWPTIDDKWDPSLFIWEKAYIRLTRLNLFFFLRIEPMTDLSNTSKTIIKIGPPYKNKENIVNLGIFKMYHKEPEYSYSFEGRSANIAPTNSDPQTDKLKLKYMEVIRELKWNSPDHSQLNTTQFDQLLIQDLEDIYNLQDDLQNSAKPMAPLESYQNNYNQSIYTLQDLQKLVHFDFRMLVKEMFNVTLTENQQFFVPDIEYLKKLDSLLFKTDKKRVLANYFATNLAMNLASHTTTKMVDLLVTKLDPKDLSTLQNICFEQTSIYLPELLGKLYLTGISQVALKWHQDVNDITLLLKQSFHTLLSGSEWMDQITIKEAVSKLESMALNIGYPDWYSDDTKFEEYCAMFSNISQEDYFSSVMTVSEASQLLSMQELNERLRYSALTSWPGHRQIIDVNAFYYFTTNGVYIPVAIAQYPFYEQGLPKAITYGSMGMIIGHEMTHAFDITGRLYDNEGALRNWWTETTADRFRNKTECFVKQYSNVVLDPTKDSMRVDGMLTLAENIADNGGLREAYRAFSIYQEKNGADKKNSRLPGEMSHFTTDQLFFLSFANMWCSRMDPSLIENDIHKNVHSPPNIRVWGSLANFENFAHAFNCSAGSKMNPEEKCILW